ncbi:hypothetical protein Bca4012_024554 [Brassica carinata]|uniref:Mei2-like C-terminal RNA recognition motif domain-containing protein n=1 Tax=Brassica carinata TaxID=52824 RepID=A0A8X7VET7_BRACI|nr:hypothetical protein Bca52824_021594 [Brassica carinata]
MASPTSSHGHSMAMMSGDVSKALNPTAPLFFPKYPPLHHYFFLPPQIHFISDPNLPLPSSIFVYYPLWYSNPNPTWFEATQELPPLHSQNPIQELAPPPTSRKRDFGRGRSSRYRNKLMWRKRIQYQAESNGDTTVMLRNIPNKYTREMLIEFLDEHCEVENNKEEGEEIAYDFLYLPIDFKRELNKGYAFVNFTKAEAVLKFKAACNNKPWYRFGSRKILEISHARIQGKDALVKHFEQMSYPVEAYRAVCFIPARRGTKSTSLTIMVGKCSEAMI